MNLTGQTVAQKPKRAKPNPAYLAKVRALPCIICTSLWLAAEQPDAGAPRHSPAGIVSQGA
jgi:hypothetical protein